MARLLVVEDVKDTNFLISTVLVSKGHEVTSCYDGRGALTALENKNFDLLLTDLCMPEKDGIDIIQALKDDEYNIPIIVISGGGVNDKGEDVIEKVQGKVQKILKKPFSKSDLLEAVSSFV